jgi:hypothetical protein
MKLFRRIFKKNRPVANLPQSAGIVVMFDPMVPCPKIPELVKFAIVTKFSETGKIDQPDYKKYSKKLGIHTRLCKYLTFKYIK